MKRLVLFGGTSEGRQIAEFCAQRKISVIVCVATAYGAQLLPDAPCLQIRVGRLEETDIRNLLAAQQPALVADATHPYAQLVSENVRAACAAEGIPYRRILRPSLDLTGCVTFPAIAPLLAYLKQHTGNILLTTGSKDLPVFTSLPQYAQRCAVRILPDGLPSALALGFAKERILCGKGPFTEAENREHLRKFDAKFLVTKESGTAGGFPEKIQAAKAEGALPLVLQRPVTESGCAPETLQQELEAWQ